MRRSDEFKMLSWFQSQMDKTRETVYSNVTLMLLIRSLPAKFLNYCYTAESGITF